MQKTYTNDKAKVNIIFGKNTNFNLFFLQLYIIALIGSPQKKVNKRHYKLTIKKIKIHISLNYPHLPHQVRRIEILRDAVFEFVIENEAVALE